MQKCLILLQYNDFNPRFIINKLSGKLNLKIKSFSSFQRFERIKFEKPMEKNPGFFHHDLSNKARMK